MNNASYLTKYEFGRFDWYLRSGCYAAAKELNSFVVVYSFTVRYRKQLKFLETFTVETQLLSYDDKYIVVEQRLVGTTGFVHSVALCKLAVVGTTPQKIFEKAGFTLPQNPLPLPPDVEKWFEV